MGGRQAVAASAELLLFKVLGAQETTLRNACTGYTFTIVSGQSPMGVAVCGRTTDVRSAVRRTRCCTGI